MFHVKHIVALFLKMISRWKDHSLLLSKLEAEILWLDVNTLKQFKVNGCLWRRINSKFVQEYFGCSSLAEFTLKCVQNVSRETLQECKCEQAILIRSKATV